MEGDHWLSALGKEFRNARLALGLSQQVVAKAVAIPRSTYSLVERAKLARLSVRISAQLAAVLGLDLYVAVYPGPPAIRDEASARLLGKLLAHVAPPLRHKMEVPLPGTADRPEQRSWDSMLFTARERTGIELDMRLHDFQAQLRRHNLKRKDDRVDHFLWVIADTRHNRWVLRAHGDLLADLPRLRTANVLELLRAGRHPPTGWILLPLPAPAPTEQQEASTSAQQEHESDPDQ